jgi:hypothetical protein
LLELDAVHLCKTFAYKAELAKNKIKGQLIEDISE